MYRGVGGGSDTVLNIPIGTTLASVCCSVGGRRARHMCSMLLYLHTFGLCAVTYDIQETDVSLTECFLIFPVQPQSLFPCTCTTRNTQISFYLLSVNLQNGNYPFERTNNIQYGPKKLCFHLLPDAVILQFISSVPVATQPVHRRSSSEKQHH